MRRALSADMLTPKPPMTHSGSDADDRPPRAHHQRLSAHNARLVVWRPRDYDE
jgi:hypothetical protein